MVFIIDKKNSIHSHHFVSMYSFKYPSISITEISQYPNTPSIIDLARIPPEGLIEVLALSIR